MLLKELARIQKNIPESTVGIEIEVEFETAENRRMCINDFDNAGLIVWVAKNDGSLRNGLEFVSRGIRLSAVESSLASIFELIDKNKSRFSARTSIHVHINCLQMEMADVWKSIYFSLLMDDAMVSLRALHRQNNRFCLPLSRCFFTLDALESSAKFSALDFPENLMKYSSVALHNLSRLGTIEFRSMEGTNDQKEIADWINLCYETVNMNQHFKDVTSICNHFIQATKPEDILGLYSERSQKYITSRMQGDLIEKIQKNAIMLGYIQTKEFIEIERPRTTQYLNPNAARTALRVTNVTNDIQIIGINQDGN